MISVMCKQASTLVRKGSIPDLYQCAAESFSMGTVPLSGSTARGSRSYANCQLSRICLLTGWICRRAVLHNMWHQRGAVTASALDFSLVGLSSIAPSVNPSVAISDCGGSTRPAVRSSWFTQRSVIRTCLTVFQPFQTEGLSSR